MPLPVVTGGKPGIVYLAHREAVRDAAQEGSPPRPWRPPLTCARALWCVGYAAALSPSTPSLYSIGRAARLQQLPSEFLDALAGHDEVLVTSREGATRGTVPMWFVIAPPGVVYLFSFAFSEKVRRWRTDPWVRLSTPDDARQSVEGVVHFVGPDELDEAMAHVVVDRWSMQGAPTIEGLRRTLRDRVHALIRVEGLGNLHKP